MNVRIRGWERISTVAQAQPFSLPIEEFLFLRHGETPRNALRLYQEPDEPLSETGLKQAKEAAGLLRALGIVRIVASTMNRAATTARMVAEACGIMPEWERDIQERLFTALWGTSSADMDWAADPPGCETLDDFMARVHRGVARTMATQQKPGKLLIVAHGGVLLAVAAMLKIVPGEAMRANARPIRFCRSGQGWRAELLLADSRPASGEV